MPAAVEPAIELVNVSVRYFVPSEVISSFKEYAIRKLQGRVEGGELVALKDVSLTVEPGERVGIIGPNGAGKSTLFRAIARVLRPSVGRVVVRGDVAPLLALGLGFHGELTGRENIVLHGTLLGRSRQEMLDLTPAITAFAELEPFLDAPIRTYSTGMSARLAFAVATEVDPDILLVDEVLAVGDERFRVKCNERMAHFRDRGKTFLLVSHALPQVTEVCQRAVWLSEGRVVRDGPAAEVCKAYLEWASGAAPASARGKTLSGSAP
jgi:ABC-type polysaccharide/polyol phosphate transport system ATPase subunit